MITPPGMPHPYTARPTTARMGDGPGDHHTQRTPLSQARTPLSQARTLIPHEAPHDAPAVATAGEGGPAAGALKEFDLKNGVHVIVEDRPGAKTADIAIGLRAGAANDPKGKSGMTSVLSAMVLEGNRRHSGRDIRREIAAEGGSTKVENGRTQMVLSSSVATEEVGTAVSLYADVFAHPNKGWSTLRKQRELTTRAIKDASTPQLNASQEFYRLMYGDQPIANPIAGSTEGVKRVGWLGFNMFANRNIVGRNIVVSYSGDASALDVKQLEKTLGKLKAGKANDASKLFTGFREGALVEVVPDETAQQVELRIGLPGVAQTDAQAAAAQVAASAMGGGFGSKLWTRLREKEQVSYGVYAVHRASPTSGLSVISGSVTPQNLRRAVFALGDEIKQAVNGGLTDDEVQLAKEREIAGLMVDYSQPGATTKTATIDALGNVAPRTLQERIDQINSVSPEQAREAIKKIFDMKNVKIVARGPIENPELIQAGLDDAQMGVKLTTVPFDKSRYGVTSEEAA